MGIMEIKWKLLFGGLKGLVRKDYLGCPNTYSKDPLSWPLSKPGSFKDVSPWFSGFLFRPKLVHDYMQGLGYLRSCSL